MKIVEKLFYNISHYKIYTFIIFVSLSFMILLANGFYVAQEELKALAEKTRESMTKDIEYTISSWIDERIHNLETTIKYFENDKIYDDEEKIKSFAALFIKNNPYFDAIQILVADKYLIFNGLKINDYRENPIFRAPLTHEEIISHQWYVQTKKHMKTTLTTLKDHGLLYATTINICTPIIEKEQFKGVLCGVIRANSIFNKIEKLHLPQDAYYFIADSKGELLTTLDNRKLEENIQNVLINKAFNFQNDESSLQEFNLDDNSILTIHPIKHFDWAIGVGMNKENIMRAGLKKITLNAGFLLLCFLILVIIINLFHEFIRRRIEKQKNEYEYILAHRSRMSEIGQLISAINHQLHQPLNSLKLLLSTTYNQSKNRILTPEILEDNLQMCEQAISMMVNTIGIFRNFYHFNENISRFSLEACVQSVLQVLEIDFRKHNINVEIANSTQSNFQITSIENFIQQILLVLLQNAKEAFLTQSNLYGNNIKISIFTEGEFSFIEVSDWGEGISKDMQSKLFDDIKNSKKTLGSGIGLYFARKLAREKLFGNIELKQSHLPTIFQFSFLTYLPNKRESYAYSDVKFIK